MTYIEFFDKNAADNICACLARKPDRVVFIGNDQKQMGKHIAKYRELFETRGENIEFVWRGVNRNKLDKILEVLSSVVEEYDDCCIGLTGGDDLYLVATGIICERYKHKNIQMHRFNLRNNTVYDCDADGETLFEGTAPELSVAENIRIYGGVVVDSETKSDGTFNWELTDEFKQDILDMWDICRIKPRDWNCQISGFAGLASVGIASEDKLTYSATRKQLDIYYEKHDLKSVYKQKIIAALLEKGLITEYSEKDGRIYITFKNEQVKRCLTKAGQALEMKIFVTALNTCDEDGNRVYNDAVNGVYIDWDGLVHTEKGTQDTENEIDILMMHGMVPVFVSCKNGKIETEELYKLSTVAERFGGSYAKKVLVAASLGNTKGDNALRQRAHDMGIRIVDRVTEKSDSELEAIIASLWHSN
ncbi:MAG: DUF1887 family protein [Clostridia bacterium]|nr:DUF1887 family protein [Clostridia bacterium]